MIQNTNQTFTFIDISGIISLVMNMFKNITVTHIDRLVTVFSEKGREAVMVDRPYYGLSFCVDGQITYTMDGQTYVSNKGNAVLLPKGATYSLHGDREGVFPVINFDCTGLSCDRITIIPLNHSQGCLQDFEAMQNLFPLPENRLKLLGVFYHLLDVMSAQQTREHILSPVPDYLETHFADPGISNSAIAQHLGISEVYFRKLFLAKYGMAPKQYILNFRIQKAKHLLTSTHLTVTEIAETCGFSSLYHFCRIFKEKTGMTPTQYAISNKVYKI